jgi:hypothetical protein
MRLRINLLVVQAGRLIKRAGESNMAQLDTIRLRWPRSPAWDWTHPLYSTVEIDDARRC